MLCWNVQRSYSRQNLVHESLRTCWRGIYNEISIKEASRIRINLKINFPSFDHDALISGCFAYFWFAFARFLRLRRSIKELSLFIILIKGAKAPYLPPFCKYAKGRKHKRSGYFNKSPSPMRKTTIILNILHHAQRKLEKQMA